MRTLHLIRPRRIPSRRRLVNTMMTALRSKQDQQSTSRYPSANLDEHTIVGRILPANRSRVVHERANNRGVPTRSDLSVNGERTADRDAKLLSVGTAVARQIRTARERTQFPHGTVRFEDEVAAAACRRRHGHGECAAVAGSKLGPTPGRNGPIEPGLRSQGRLFSGHGLSQGNRSDGESDHHLRAQMSQRNSLMI